MSLDSLSSPSPSPSPEPEVSQPGPEPTGAGLDSDSELSELTEEEQEVEKQDKYQTRREGRYGRPRRSLRRGGTTSVPRSEWRKRRKGNQANDTVVEEEEEEEMSGPPKAMEEEEEEDEGDDSGPSHPRSRPKENGVEDEDDEDDDGADGDDAGTGRLVDAIEEDDYVSGDDERKTRGRRSARRPRPPTYQDGDLAYPLSTRQTNASDYEDEDDDLSDPPAGPRDDNIDSDNDNVTDSEDEDTKNEGPVMARLSSPSISKSTKLSPSTIVDFATPMPHPVTPLAAVAAASSIMAGSSVIDPPSPSPSSSSASRSAASSRTPSPALRVASKGTKQADGESPAVPKRDTKQKLGAADKYAEIPPLSTDKLDSNAPDAEMPEPDGSVEDLEVDEPEPEQDMETELDSDLQPAHRAEALDVLATIELKFALLREKVYVEKMEDLAWEEVLIREGVYCDRISLSCSDYVLCIVADHAGTHPELIHLHAELSKRRDKRLELATLRRTYEMASVTKKRSMDENATWSWWKVKYNFSCEELMLTVMDLVCTR